MSRQKSKTYDNEMLLKDAGAVAASAAGTVGGAAKVVDLGPGRVDAVAVVDVTAIDVTTGDEAYRLAIQGSNDGFATKVNLGILHIGSDSVIDESADSKVGVYELPFTNERLGTIYQQIRLYDTIVGTTPSLNCTVHVEK